MRSMSEKDLERCVIISDHKIICGQTNSGKWYCKELPATTVTEAEVLIGMMNRVLNRFNCGDEPKTGDGTITNFYSKTTIDKIKQGLKKQGVPLRNIPLDAFEQAVMNIIGSKIKTTREWVKSYVKANVITVSKTKDDEWVVNFNKEA